MEGKLSKCGGEGGNSIYVNVTEKDCKTLKC